MTDAGVPAEVQAKLLGAQRPADLRDRAEAVRHRGGGSDRAPRLVPPGSRARRVGASWSPIPARTRPSWRAGPQRRAAPSPRAACAPARAATDGRRSSTSTATSTSRPAIWDEYVPCRAAGRWPGPPSTTRSTTTATRLPSSTARPGRELNRSRLVRQAIWRPGMTAESIGQLDPDVFQPLNPGACGPASPAGRHGRHGRRPGRRVPDPVRRVPAPGQNPDAAAVLARAYNDWVWDFAGTRARPAPPGGHPPDARAAAGPARARPGRRQGLPLGDDPARLLPRRRSLSTTARRRRPRQAMTRS